MKATILLLTVVLLLSCVSNREYSRKEVKKFAQEEANRINKKVIVTGYPIPGPIVKPKPAIK